MDDRLINGIFEQTKDLILDGIDENDKTQFLVDYKKYLIDSYAGTLDEGDDLEKVIKIYVKMEQKKWSNVNINKKLSTIVPDEALRKLGKLSELGYKHAQKRMTHLINNMEYNDKLSIDQAKSYINEMEKLSKQVKPYNVNLANNYLSEGTLDFMFASEMTNDMSLRTARMR